MGNTIMRVASFNHSSAAAMSRSEETTSVAATVQQGKAPFQRISPSGPSVPRRPRKPSRGVENYQQITLDQVKSSLKIAQYQPLIFVKTTLATIPEGSEEPESPR